MCDLSVELVHVKYERSQRGLQVLHVFAAVTTGLSGSGCGGHESCVPSLTLQFLSEIMQRISP